MTELEAARHEKTWDCRITCDILRLLFSQLMRYLNQAAGKRMRRLQENKLQRSVVWCVCVVEQIKGD